MQACEAAVSRWRRTWLRCVLGPIWAPQWLAHPLILKTAQSRNGRRTSSPTTASACACRRAGSLCLGVREGWLRVEGARRWSAHLQRHLPNAQRGARWVRPRLCAGKYRAADIRASGVSGGCSKIGARLILGYHLYCPSRRRSSTRCAIVHRHKMMMSALGQEPMGANGCCESEAAVARRASPRLISGPEKSLMQPVRTPVQRY